MSLEAASLVGFNQVVEPDLPVKKVNYQGGISAPLIRKFMLNAAASLACITLVGKAV